MSVTLRTEQRGWEEVRKRTTNVIQNAGPGFVFD